MQIVPYCFDCKHFIHDRKYTCKYFPGGIPKYILLNKTKCDKFSPEKSLR